MELFKLFCAYVGPSLTIIGLGVAIWTKGELDIVKTSAFGVSVGITLWMIHVGFIL